jgi:hypothetical protein
MEGNKWQPINSCCKFWSFQALASSTQLHCLHSGNGLSHKWTAAGTRTRTRICYTLSCQVMGQAAHVLRKQLPYILESNPHPFYSCRGLKMQMRISIERGLDSRIYGMLRNFPFSRPLTGTAPCRRVAELCSSPLHSNTMRHVQCSCISWSESPTFTCYKQHRTLCLKLAPTPSERHAMYAAYMIEFLETRSLCVTWEVGKFFHLNLIPTCNFQKAYDIKRI